MYRVIAVGSGAAAVESAAVLVVALSAGRAGNSSCVLVGYWNFVGPWILNGREVRLCDPCARVHPCGLVSRV